MEALSEELLTAWLTAEQRDQQPAVGGGPVLQ